MWLLIITPKKLRTSRHTNQPTPILLIMLSTHMIRFPKKAQSPRFKLMAGDVVVVRGSKSKKVTTPITKTLEASAETIEVVVEAAVAAVRALPEMKTKTVLSRKRVTRSHNTVSTVVEAVAREVSSAEATGKETAAIAVTDEGEATEAVKVAQLPSKTRLRRLAGLRKLSLRPASNEAEARFC